MLLSDKWRALEVVEAIGFETFFLALMRSKDMTGMRRAILQHCGAGGKDAGTMKYVIPGFKTISIRECGDRFRIGGNYLTSLYVMPPSTSIEAPVFRFVGSGFPSAVIETSGEPELIPFLLTLMRQLSRTQWSIAESNDGKLYLTTPLYSKSVQPLLSITDLMDSGVLIMFLKNAVSSEEGWTFVWKDSGDEVRGW